MTMRIVIDLQACQSHGNRHRGIGRYGLVFTKAILKAAAQDEVWVALNGELANSVEYIRGALDGLLPQERIVTWKAIPGTALVNPVNRWRHDAAAKVREAFLESLQPDVVHVCNLFDGYHEDIVVTVPKDAPYVTTVTLHDLIPLIYSDAYLADPKVRAWYMEKLEHLKRADSLLAISEDACNDARQLLGISAEKLANVQSASDSIFQPAHIAEGDVIALRARYGLNGRFLMYTGGIDYRKNVEGMIGAYARLPDELRGSCQLAIVCAAHSDEIARLRRVCAQAGLKDEEVVFTGYVSDADLLALYNICSAFVFPSWHEGFGLPALEAMACGAPTIGSRTSSIPEVIGRDDALFDPRDLDEMAASMLRVLTDESFRQELRLHGPSQAAKFSWDESSRRILAAMREAVARCRHKQRTSAPRLHTKPLLAFVTPLPPMRSGVADYSARLLPALAEHYRIEVISDQTETSDSWVGQHIPLRSTEWYERNADQYDRVLYHVGDGALHRHVPEVLERRPGTVVMSEIFLGGITSNLEWSGDAPGYFTRCLYQSHGYRALIARKQREGGTQEREALIEHWPSSLPVIRDAEGVIVHSQFACELADNWYGAGTSDDWTVAPLQCEPPQRIPRDEARKRLGLSDGELLVCCFGVIGPLKRNRALVDAWLTSALGRDPRARLALVGGSYNPHYVAQLQRTIAESAGGDRVCITGWADGAVYEDYLAAADIAVQLRSAARGESSGSVLDCLAYGLPTIVNAHGMLAELPGDAVLRIPQDFDTAELAGAMEKLARDSGARQELGRRAREYCVAGSDPKRLALSYRDAIEKAHRNGPRARAARLARDIVRIDSSPGATAEDMLRLVKGIAANQRRRDGLRQMLVDVSELVRRDVKSGIQRVVRSVLLELLQSPPEGFLVEPVYAQAGGRYRYARAFTANFLDLNERMPADEPVDTHPGDLFLGLDLIPELPTHRVELRELRARGVHCHFVLYDLLPMTRSDCFPQGAYEGYGGWLETIADVADGVFCISRAAAEELRRHLDSVQIPRERPLTIGWFHLGADIASSAPTSGIEHSERMLLEHVGCGPSFLMVGTIEPRKGHVQALSAFESLWAEGSEARLVLVGKPGWNMDGLAGTLRAHGERNKRLFWFESASDELLAHLYETCSALLLASEGEGFGLPLIEAAEHGLPILCRDLPVFVEIAGSHAAYFHGFEPRDLAAAVRVWLADSQSGETRESSKMPRHDWVQATRQLLDRVLHGSDATPWFPGRRLWLPSYDRRLQIGCGERIRDRVVSHGGAGPLLRGWAMPFLAGRYRLKIYGEWLAPTGHLGWLLRGQAGESVTSGGEFHATQVETGLLLEDDLELAHDQVLNFELHVGSDARVSVLGCSIESEGAKRGVGASPMRRDERQLLVDVSELARRDGRSGIQRVVRSIVGALLESPPPGFRVKPVRAEPGQPYRYARTLEARFAGESGEREEPAIEARAGDVFLGLDLAAIEWITAPHQYRELRERGVSVYPVLYDLLPLLRSDCFADAHYVMFAKLVAAFAEAADGIVCISRAVADDLARYLDAAQPGRTEPLKIGWFHLGADLEASRPSAGMSNEELVALEKLRGQRSFLVVGTLEPRKGHSQTLDAFESLWARGSSAALVLVGAQGWQTDVLARRLREHPRNGSQLFWFERASDELLAKLYAQCSALLAPSEGEGFGLPLIEAAQHGLPILCRDIPVFREIAAEHADYFAGYEPESMARAIERWLVRDLSGQAPSSRGLPWLTWRQSAAQLINVALGGHWIRQWHEAESCWFAAHDSRIAQPLIRRKRGLAVSESSGGDLLQSWPVEVKAGAYRARVRGEWWSESGTARLELLAGTPLRTLAQFEFRAGSRFGHNAVLLDAACMLAQDVSDLVLRVSTDPGSELALEGFGLQSSLHTEGRHDAEPAITISADCGWEADRRAQTIASREGTE